ncbi:peptidoglycan bridge formation glycyltransferase FemA/FemB family protein [Pseudalkalibacillus hwajinpoensis]|uniref:Lipid II:glycine glycyltransferase n=1 Tax=Guptibacillus hwajinpoensis TaxID=208199 RepID=A0A4V5PYN2_9BACL|nr:peptidoglycan bridge formation glycyltransferase FemA/FemB family protein [Pseudalkalibacillus hwajinpoensis]TKD70798.1 GNAT family N-acetyltransferase [Pseudalkalibacillus hwajinpoensis]
MGTKLFGLNDKKNWHDYLNRLNNKDVYYTPEYCEIHERNGDGVAQLYLYEEGSDFVLYPYLLRCLNTLPHLCQVTQKYGNLYDITTPYGYGGPLTNVKEEARLNEILSRFTNSFRDYCKNADIITEFIRFHPLYQNHNLFTCGEKFYIRDTIYVDLTKDYDEIWANYDTKNRNRIRKSKSYDLQIKHRNRNERQDLLRLYNSTMKRTGAKEYYYFSDTYFQDTLELLGDNVELIEVVTEEEKVVMSVIFMLGDEYIHYHLLGSDQEYLRLATNNLVVDYMVQWAKERGFKAMHLGGGYAGNNDSLYRFKKHFNKNGALPFYIGKQIHNETIYKELAASIPEECQGYFPVYRHSNLTQTRPAEKMIKIL